MHFLYNLKKEVIFLSNGTIFSIEEFSVYDGPGIRTTIFLKGCPLKCTWCHNPEGQNSIPEIIRSPNGCIGCNKCMDNASIKNGKIIYTTDSIKKCPMHLLRVCGEITDSEELCHKLLKNNRILNNGGGVTFSGGEPLLQSEFVFSCLDILKDKLHTAIQTCGYCKEEIFDIALKKSDYFLYDLKIFDDNMHRKYTGVSNALIIKNFIKLAKSKKDFTIRIPLIPNVTDTKENITRLAELLSDNKIRYVELLPYNKMAGGKYKMLQREYTPDFDEKAEINTNEDIFKKYSIKTKIL